MSAVKRSRGCDLASCRTRARPLDTLSRHCVRRVIAPPLFPFASPLRSIDSAVVITTLFADLNATMGDSDFLESFVIGVRQYAFPMRTGRSRAGRLRDLPVPKQGTSAHAGFSDHAGSRLLSRLRAPPCCLPPEPRRRHPKGNLRGSMAGLCMPRPTLRRRPHGRRRTAWGRYDSLGLYRQRLSLHIPCRSPGARFKFRQPFPPRSGCLKFLDPQLVSARVRAARPQQSGRSRCLPAKTDVRKGLEYPQRRPERSRPPV
jgi:hypothetical protein